MLKQNTRIMTRGFQTSGLEFLLQRPLIRRFREAFEQFVNLLPVVIPLRYNH